MLVVVWVGLLYRLELGFVVVNDEMVWLEMVFRCERFCVGRLD